MAYTGSDVATVTAAGTRSTLRKTVRRSVACREVDEGAMPAGWLKAKALAEEMEIAATTAVKEKRTIL
eukprot:CAMPEP_0113311328 /NCGR_PEP_ID=MMETSP0010_2-20120614/8613_1 /TAXON_ID=216773 ORGANISM="Corethron hystrix, Strain 308" /NCGR_SAMPLE_ID=MMETSP0010_2 /ASSEMBLY_ACC=CAM_ASM_000155 /LENGTH=67 /DNA_ID=CAMNT_0000166953 /DNA_START=624 /DNA_END=824 /DNA_ORIENTATION=+ /assembly_acc=CAM_ASM_000155